jgi:hypothetical protein
MSSRRRKQRIGQVHAHARGALTFRVLSGVVIFDQVAVFRAQYS